MHELASEEERRRQRRADRRLARRLKAGDRGAFEEFFGAHVQGLYRYVRARLGDAEATREVAQSTLCEAMKSLGSYRGEGPLAAWLFVICRHEISAHFRRLQRFERRTAPLADAVGLVERLDRGGAGDHDLELHRREIAGHVHRTLDRLPPRYGAALEWKYVDGLSVDEIARRLATSAKAAESLLTRARHAFRKLFTTTEDPP